MLLFLKIVAAVLVAICLLVAIAFWLFRRWIRKIGAAGVAAARLIDDRWMRPARLRLKPAADFEPSESFSSLWRSLHAQGFRKLGDLEDSERALVLRAAWLESGAIGAAVVEDCGRGAVFTLFAIDRQRGMIALSAEAGSPLRLERLDWQFEEGLRPDTALDRFAAQVRDGELLKLDVRAFRVAWEQAHATRADHELQRKPGRMQIEQAAAAQHPPASAEQVEQAYQIVLDHWQDQLQVALLDHYRRSSRIDAVAWEDIKDNLHVVHDQLGEQQIESMLVDDDAGQHVLKQCVAQGFQGIALYEQVLQRLPAAGQRVRIAEVEQPVRAVVYGLRENDTATVAASGHFLYEAVQADGGAARGTLIATSAADAMRQAENMGLRDVKIVLEPNPVDASASGVYLDPEAAAIAARSVREGISVAVLRALRANAWIWAPPVLLLAWVLHDGLPLGWGGTFAVLYALVATAALVFLIAPMVLYNLVLRARLAARWRAATVCVLLLERVSLFGGITRTQLRLERAKILAAQGQLERALVIWRSLASTMAEPEFQQGLSQIYDAGGEHQKMIEAQRAAVTDSPTKDMATVDLALSLARFGDAQEAESILATVKSRNLSQLALAGYQITRGILHARQGRHDVALREYSQAIGELEAFKSNPLILVLIAETNAYAAISFKRLGQAERAGKLWQHVWPILRVHRGSERLALEYEAAPRQGATG